MALSTKYTSLRGFSLIEAAIVLGVVGLVIGGIWIAAETVMTRVKTSQYLSHAGAAARKAISAMQDNSAGHYTVGDFRDLRNMGIYDSSWTPAAGDTYITDPYLGFNHYGYLYRPPNGQNEFNIEFYGNNWNDLPRQACIDAVKMYWDLGNSVQWARVRVMIGGYQSIRTAGSGTLDLDALASACATPYAYIDATYRDY